MSLNSFTDSLSRRFQELSTVVSERTSEISTNIPSLAQSTQRLVQERLGNVTDISQLPQEYLELERQVDTVKLIFEHFLQITSIYENESYDYPKHINDSVNDYSKIFADKVTELSRATSAQEAQNILVTPVPSKEPRTLNYALSRVSFNASESLNAFSDPSNAEVSTALLQFSDVQSKIGQARLAQDTMIQTKFNKKLREKLEQGIATANSHRRDVQYKRLQYDVARTNFSQAKPEKEASLRVEMETLEEQFAQATEEATVIMQQVLADSKFLGSLKELAAAQREYYEASAKLLTEFMPILENDEDEEAEKAKQPAA